MQKIIRSIFKRCFGPRSAEWLLPLFAPYLLSVFGLFLLGVFVAGLSLIPPYLTKLIIDNGLLAGNKSALITYSVALFFVGLVSVGLGVLNSLLHLRFSIRMLMDMRRQFMDLLLHHSPRWHARQQIGEIMAQYDGDTSQVQQFSFNFMLTGVSQSLRLIGGLVMLFVLNWQLALIVSLLIPLELWFLVWAYPKTEKWAGNLRQTRGENAAFATQSISAHSAIISESSSSYIMQKLNEVQSNLIKVTEAMQRWSEFVKFVPTLLTALIRSFVFLLGGLWVISGDMPLGSLIAFIAYITYVIGPAQSLLGLIQAHAKVKVSLKRLSDIISEQPEVSSPENPMPLPGQFDLQLEYINIQHPQTSGPILKDVSFLIQEGAKFHLQGRSGLGKSSLLALLQRQFDPNQGTIKLGGVDLKQLDLKELREAVVMVPQVGFVFEGTIAENLTLNQGPHDKEACRQALRDAQLWPWFETQEQGLDTVITERGQHLSGGERQRLVLARVFLKPFKILILDEALSETDSQATSAIIKTIDEKFKDRTRIIVTHGNVQNYGQFDQQLDLDQTVIA